MLRYAAASAASKAFSLNATTRRAYRVLGNIALDRIRTAGGIPQPYLDRAARLIEVCDRRRILAPGDHVLELGTGWVHWEATILRLFHDVDVTLFDVCDNRLLTTYRSWMEQLGAHLETGFDISPERRERAQELLARVVRVESFAELYDLMGFSYVLEPNGSLEGLPAQRYALVVSADVLEHVEADTLAGYLDAARRRLVPGGYSVHQIDLVDHFSYFDRTCSPKHYYRYTDRTWRRWFQSDVQYFNRLQRPEWLDIFTVAGFELLEDERISGPIGALPLAADYQHLDRSDLECLQMLTVHRRPTG